MRRLVAAIASRAIVALLLAGTGCHRAVSGTYSPRPHTEKVYVDDSVFEIDAQVLTQLRISSSPQGMSVMVMFPDAYGGGNRSMGTTPIDTTVTPIQVRATGKSLEDARQALRERVPREWSVAFLKDGSLGDYGKVPARATCQLHPSGDTTTAVDERPTGRRTQVTPYYAQVEVKRTTRTRVPASVTCTVESVFERGESAASSTNSVIVIPR